MDIRFGLLKLRLKRNINMESYINEKSTINVTYESLKFGFNL